MSNNRRLTSQSGRYASKPASAGKDIQFGRRRRPTSTAGRSRSPRRAAGPDSEQVINAGGSSVRSETAAGTASSGGPFRRGVPPYEVGGGPSKPGVSANSSSTATDGRRGTGWCSSWNTSRSPARVGDAGRQWRRRCCPRRPPARVDAELPADHRVVHPCRRPRRRRDKGCSGASR